MWHLQQVGEVSLIDRKNNEVRQNLKKLANDPQIYN